MRQLVSFGRLTRTGTDAIVPPIKAIRLENRIVIELIPGGSDGDIWRCGDVRRAQGGRGDGKLDGIRLTAFTR